jgi:ribosomal protein S18 acetylase RimI-like enzyme
MSDVVVRAALEAEAEAIATLLREAFLPFELLYTPAGFAATTPTAAQIRDRWGEGPVWVALDDTRLLGTVAAVPTGRGLYMRSMAVAPSARGRGVGSALLAQVEDFARARGLERVFLSTTPFLHDAIRLYHGAGFARVKEGPHELGGTPLFTMERWLAAKAKR